MNDKVVSLKTTKLKWLWNDVKVLSVGDGLVWTIKCLGLA